ncbi:hypothetical protein BOTBODRAFT_148093 [Botryobasidium botryosum FD-172 SS1]|uniref:Uncharacterized protein n=1 Tax=Botryobasidium botryosum (strain FD-172 SS1) TaxID=930990 RepID=A0A067MCQ6_BOTB1|nr:hypothetical protein BOTBODRAFT_148093 [Botryobasidium botryosum FD-172 SS1]
MSPLGMRMTSYLYGSFDTSTSDDLPVGDFIESTMVYPTRFSGYAVTALTKYIKLSKTRHEFVVLTLEHQKSTRPTHYLRLERTAGSTTSFTKACKAVMKGFIPPASDTYRLTKKKEDATHCGTEGFEHKGTSTYPSAPTLQSFTAMLAVIEAFSSDYVIDSNQCYWYAECVAFVYRQMCLGSNAHSRHIVPSAREPIPGLSVEVDGDCMRAIGWHCQELMGRDDLWTRFADGLRENGTKGYRTLLRNILASYGLPIPKEFYD